MYYSFMAAAVLSLCAHMLKADNIKYNISVWNRCFKPQDNFVNLIGISVQECVEACVKRHSCKSLAYNRGMNFCELHKNETLEPHPTATACVLIRRVDMETESAQNCRCTHVGHVCNLELGHCEITECGMLDLPNGNVYGNGQYIGAKLRVSCLQGYVEPRGVKQVACNTTGDWDPTPTCIPASTATVAITATESSVGGTDDDNEPDDDRK